MLHGGNGRVCVRSPGEKLHLLDCKLGAALVGHRVDRAMSSLGKHTSNRVLLVEPLVGLPTFWKEHRWDKLQAGQRDWWQ